MSDLIVMTMVFLMLAFTYLGISTPVKLFSLLSGGIALALIIELQTYTAVVIVLVGFIFFQIWYATIGGRQ